MTQTRSPFPFVRLTKSHDLVLYLIQEELKAQKFFNGLADLGLGDSQYRPSLGTVILSQLHMDDGSDDILNFYHAIIAKRCRKIHDDHKSIMKQTMKVYAALVAEKERRKE